MGVRRRLAYQEKLLPPDFIRADGYGITDAARRDLAPLRKLCKNGLQRIAI